MGYTLDVVTETEGGGRIIFESSQVSGLEWRVYRLS